MKALIFVAAAALSLALAVDGHAQTTSPTSASASTGTATAIVMNGALNGAMTGGPAGAAVGAAAAASQNIGTLSNPQFVMGQTGAAPGMVTYDACQLSRSGGLGPLSGGWTQTIDDCYAQRQAQMAKDMGMMPMAYEIMCNVPRWQQADVNTGAGMCSQARTKAAQGRPVASIPTPASQGINVSSGPAVPAAVQYASIPEAERCYGAGGVVSGHLVNGVCQ